MNSTAGNCFYKDVIYKVGVYARVSREDFKKKNGESSESIKNQVDYLKRIANENGWVIIDIYADDGISGTDFDRPDFHRMINDIEDERINLVITKDLSRLGRDYVETGYYIEKYFPTQNIRYIAVDDGIDTFLDTNGNDMGPFKSVMNDLYAKDISKKVKSTIGNKRLEGKFIGAFAPYGYDKDPTDKNKLIINAETSEVVKRIYTMYLQGNGLRNIAFTLNEEGIESPANYKRRNTKYRGGRTKNFIWGPETVKLILTNPTYKGFLAQNKVKKVNYKVKVYKKIPPKSWVIVPNTHEPIIDGVTFDTVQKMLENKAGIKRNNSGYHLLSGMIYCGDCGARMTFISGSNGIVYAVCSFYKRFKKCSRHSFEEKKLESIVLNELKDLSQETLDRQRFLGKVIKNADDMLSKSRQKCKENESLLNGRLHEINLIIKNLYEDKVNGIFSESDFKEILSLYNKERNNVFKRLEDLRKIKMREEDIKDSMEISSMINTFINFEAIGKLTLTKLINRIEIFENSNLKIFYNFKNPFERSKTNFEGSI